MTDYHVKPRLQARVPAAALAWARAEAKRRGLPFGDFIDGLITAERQRAERSSEDFTVFPVAADD